MTEQNTFPEMDIGSQDMVVGGGEMFLGCFGTFWSDLDSALTQKKNPEAECHQQIETLIALPLRSRREVAQSNFRLTPN